MRPHVYPAESSRTDDSIPLTTCSPPDPAAILRVYFATTDDLVPQPIDGDEAHLRSVLGRTAGVILSCCVDCNQARAAGLLCQVGTGFLRVT